MTNPWDAQAAMLDNPPACFRGKPFWAWNGLLEPGELRRQIRVMRRMGLGGFFMHARVGLATPYLGDEWFALVDACIDEAGKLGMEAWLYDEDRWPSGAAGGLVTKNPEFRARSLRARRVERVNWNDAPLAAALLEFLDDQTVAHVRPLARGKPVPKKGPRDRLVEFRVAVDAESSWFNGQTYLDAMNPAAVREFIRVTHEVYKKRCGKHFGKLVPGIFTDEAYYLGGGISLSPVDAEGRPASEYSLPWTGALPGRFRKSAGYALDVFRMAELFWNVEGADAAHARWHYHETVTALFVEAFARQIGRWCEKNKLLLTGHVGDEDSLAGQIAFSGVNMRFYEPMQAPGMDLLTERDRVYSAAKQVSSAARQFGRKWRLTETYGCTGWDFSFPGHKALGDWQAALGVNLRCHHLYWYTMLGEAKRDYPAAIGHQSPWWDHYAKVEDYFARVHAMMTRGREVRDLLVVHPIESMRLLTRVGWRGAREVLALDRGFLAVCDALLAATIDFDFGDEELLSRHAGVRGGKGGAGPGLKMGAAEYRAVLVPAQVRTMRASTLALLKRFRAAGGTVVFVGDGPDRLDARIDPAPKAFAAGDGVCRVPGPGPALIEAVECCRRVSATDGSGREIAPILHLLREDDEAFRLFLCNVGHDFAADSPAGNGSHEPRVRDRKTSFDRAVVVCAPEAAGRPVEYDAFANAFFACDARRTPAGWAIETSFPALGSRLFVFPKKADAERDKAAGKLPVRASQAATRRRRLGKGPWDCSLSEDNALVLDRPRARFGDGPLRDACDVLAVDSQLRAAMGVPPRGRRMVQPWARPAPKNPKRLAVSLVYDFGVEAVPSGDLHLALERPETFRVALNGRPVPTESECGWWVDKSLRRVPLPAERLRAGANELRLDIDYDETHPGLEIVYLLGDFGVAVSGTAVRLTAPPRRLALGDWTEQGLPFYAGHAAYRIRTTADFDPASERVRAGVPEYAGAAVRIWIDGREAGMPCWPPNEVDITDFIRPGVPFDLAFQVLGHRRNSHGPLHLKERWPVWTGPEQYVRGGDGDAGWREDYSLVPCGLTAEPELLFQPVEKTGKLSPKEMACR